MYDMFKFLFFQSWPCCSRLYIGMVSFRLWFSQIELRAPPWVEPLAQFDLYIFSTLRFFWTFFHFANIFWEVVLGSDVIYDETALGGYQLHSTAFNRSQPASQLAWLTDDLSLIICKFWFWKSLFIFFSPYFSCGSNSGDRGFCARNKLTFPPCDFNFKPLA